MNIRMHGACGEVGRSGILVEDKGKRVMLDYGVKIVQEENTYPLPVQGYLDAVILSHAHLDHSGSVPLLYENSEQPLYATAPTMRLVEMLVEDSIKVNALKGLEAIFDKRHMKRMMRNVSSCRYGREVREKQFSFKFEDAGHILGASSVQLDMGNRRVVYSGDFKLEATRLHEPAFCNYKDVDVLITEATYGSKIHENRRKIEKEFVEECWNVCDSDGIVIVPAFAVGRAQEIVSVLVNNHFEYPVYLDGMAKKSAEIMMEFPGFLKNYKEFYKAMKKAVWIENEKDRKEALRQPGVIVSTAGMLSGGPAVSYIMKIRDYENKAVFFSGYQAHGTPGRKLLDTGRMEYEGFDLDFTDYNIKKFDFSAHADKLGLLEFAKKCG
ncbi:MAG: MBL fold metallo-hydrolase, partial [Candidatus Micrarchaeota archaeon]